MREWKDSEMCTRAFVLGAALIVALVSGVLGGCAAVPAAALTMGVTAAESGSAYMTRGELRGALHHDFEEVVASARVSLGLLAFEMVRTNEKEGFVYLLADDDRGRRVSVRIWRRTAELTTVRIRYGVFADRHVAAVLYETMLQEIGKIPEGAGESSG